MISQQNRINARSRKVALVLIFKLSKVVSSTQSLVRSEMSEKSLMLRIRRLETMIGGKYEEKNFFQSNYYLHLSNSKQLPMHRDDLTPLPGYMLKVSIITSTLKKASCCQVMDTKPIYFHMAPNWSLMSQWHSGLVSPLAQSLLKDPLSVTEQWPLLKRKNPYELVVVVRELTHFTHT